jgi:hypothetical protein
MRCIYLQINAKSKRYRGVISMLGDGFGWIRIYLFARSPEGKTKSQ